MKNSKPAPRPGRRPAQSPGGPARPRKVNADSSLAAFVVEQLGRIPAMRSRAMFGGHGIYSGDTFFAIVFGGRVYLRIDPAQRERFESLGMLPFTPGPGTVMRAYYELPLDVLESSAEFVVWARDAIRAARARSKAPRVHSPGR